MTVDGVGSVVGGVGGIVGGVGSTLGGAGTTVNGLGQHVENVKRSPLLDAVVGNPVVGGVTGTVEGVVGEVTQGDVAADVSNILGTVVKRSSILGDGLDSTVNNIEATVSQATGDVVN